ncbi:PITH domain-containing protein [Emericellopsis atlantica]|uniref:PITH domain-containing protein n=1 Tax=Emericellopsis atlantica TaxID=2614577 RepID=A0A9P7ZSG6_9HYPO|nr:PITH domain-containing protein [Emericellopsis atlantica]KAG9257017.1 PITH domain-containing protein [Emericellopsis atlantica]
MAQGPTEITSSQQFKDLLRSSTLVVADFYADWCAPCKQIAPVYESLAKSLSRPGALAFAKVNTENNSDISAQYHVTALPTFLVFRGGKVEDTVQGADPTKLKNIVQKLLSEVESMGEASGSGGSGSGGQWLGADVPRGYREITDEVEVRNCEILNADEDAGTVKTLFETQKPTGFEKASTSRDYVQSGADDQLLLYIPFQSTVKLHTLQITSLPAEGDDAPARPGVVRLFINRPQNMDFSEADDSEPTQAIELGPNDWNANGTANIPLRFVKFQKTNTVIVYVQRGDGEAETVRVDRLRLIGEAGAKREMGKLQKIGDEPGE